ncbi:30S ribosomal protein S7 [Candidatus Uhrbacteria bacterium RIFOXYB12_FULL_58_10]|uniref:Small ribosomal subunit protein uS7 n=1 Tax=Candidatus Uhrbacteria bacterium RIFOXYB2_FULL_57_15 TaxID=1802422 RepID=A0A1F7W8B9_9BACT|nr:MAG: 30S ribosomal protein S7 [Candidatus Uhrbacteria bacterium RIFOXYB12_FULL_58_10]OGL99043.1 MAG: 30S ribosomal protein S7 [Candidatus Uhrbacteria bacterium RIFOXYB2_FULL_57_15]OGM00264.1 MAG: 30S ribosomal protein S7 [Candidatus Uhrbacteria bacterium RIFOXYC12_FULL_57_11]
MRGKAAVRRAITPDPKFGNENLARFTNLVMRDGKKSTAMRVMYDCLDIIAKKTEQDPVEVFETALKNVMPTLEVKSKRVGGANYQVPMPVRGERRFMLAARWILTATRAKKGRPMAIKLSDELMAAAKNEGDAVKKKADVQRMAEANRAFAHFAR